MSPQLRIQASQCFSPNNKTRFRNLIHSSEPPTSPLLKGTKCDAVEIDGQPCSTVLESEGQAWCMRHFNEMKSLNTDWKQAQQEAVFVQSLLTPDVAKIKIYKLCQALELRKQISRRFYKRGGDTADHIQWIVELERDVRGMADRKMVSTLSVHRPTVNSISPCSGLDVPITVHQSPLDPRVPIAELQHIPDDGTILIFKQFSANLCADAIRRLYTRILDGGTDILRAWFRVFVLHESEPDVLEHATQAATIDEFLKGRHASEVETYIDFFEKAWRPHALQYLRVATCAQTLAARDVRTIRILGGIIPCSTEGLRMIKPCWDMLHRWLPQVLTPWTFGSICQNFDDYTTICKLSMIGLYRENWYDPDIPLLDCTTGVYFGFIPSSKGLLSSSAEQTDDSFVEVESRNYVTGQMAIGDLLAEALLDELRKRTERLVLVAYEGVDADPTIYPADDDLFITRKCSAKTKEMIDAAKWTTEVALEDIKNDLRLRKTSTYDPIVVESWQIVIIDKTPGLSFSLFDIVDDALLMLTGDPSPREVAKQVIRDVIPPAVQQIFLDQITWQDTPDIRYPPPECVKYEGSRVRCWDLDQGLLASRRETGGFGFRDENRFIMTVVDEMERNGLIRLVKEYKAPQTRPVVLQGVDGALDLYFPYDFGADTDLMQLTSSLRVLPPPNCLLEFANSFKEKHPNAVVAKGSVQTNYCAWPMPAVGRLGKGGLNFATWEGHIYQWNVMPFDRPWSERAWQYCLDHYMNSQYPFVMFYLTTFVICAENETKVEEVMAAVLNEAEQHDWKVIIPPCMDFEN
ncbi:uncharacterized protein BDZ99DRAFT_569863 [Mytilinidion resinicola]|uniref:Uncharacterized protein n=1 Tax=Mytilinidion resinicola TaxID=574789 RepID=A0A6A6YSL9_9PEZI|nr:uncharacterized protein BDZ99DRAFT_569863 [Mytilinidion resinicola]KAF2811922.1 hypothetical protein BDZ99DRAFT_569863 [Mytilinidion resinicola]